MAQGEADSRTREVLDQSHLRRLIQVRLDLHDALPAELKRRYREDLSQVPIDL
jgi:hypothetical protein